jgi:hypothetical protein
MKIAIIIILIIAVGLLAVYAWLGSFTKVQFSVQQAGGEVLVYEPYTGDYKNAGKIMDKMYYALLNEEKVECFRGFGIYYDNPQQVEKSKLRSDVGNILEEPTPELLEKLESKYNIKTLDRQQFVVTEFPYKNQMSIVMGIMKVYPALNRYCKENQINENGFVMEIYDVPGKKIVYRKQM